MIEEGKTVKVHYVGTLGDGNVFDSSEGGDPLEFEIGAGQVIPGFEDAVKELEVGETKKVEIASAEAYGDTRDDLIGEAPLDRLPDDLTPEIGMVLQMQTPDGAMAVRVVDMDEENMTLDANHPLAGQDLTFELTLVEIV